MRMRRGDAAGAADAYGTEVDTLVAAFGDASVLTAEARHRLAAASSAAGDDAALMTLARAGVGNDAREAAILAGLGEVDERQDRPAEAAHHYEQAIAINVRLQVPGDSHPRALDGLGRLALARGDAAAARQQFNEAMRLRLSMYGDDHPEIAKSLTHLARAALLAGDRNRAHLMLLNAVQLVQDRLGRQSRLLVEPIVLLAEVENDERATSSLDWAYSIDAGLTLARVRAAVARTHSQVLEAWLESKR
jgi:hypothetical protein